MATLKKKPTLAQRMTAGLKSVGTYLYSAIAGPPKPDLVVDSVLADGLNSTILYDFLSSRFPKKKFPNYHIIIGKSDMGDSYQFQAPRPLDQNERNELDRMRWSGGLGRKPSEEALSPEEAKRRRRGGGLERMPSEEALRPEEAKNRRRGGARGAEGKRC